MTEIKRKFTTDHVLTDMKDMNDINSAIPIGDKCGYIYKTHLYHAFSFLNVNRPLNEKKITSLKENIKENGLIIPITVNPKFQIIDGQHRFEALKELGYDIEYNIRNTKNTDIADVNNTGSGWIADNYTNLWSVEGDNTESYNYYNYLLIKYNKMNSKISLGANDLRAVILNQYAFTNSTKEVFDKGQMKIKRSKKEIEYILDLVFEHLPSQIPSHILNKKKFQRTLFYLINNKNLNLALFVKTVTKKANITYFGSDGFLGFPQKILTNLVIDEYNSKLKGKYLKIPHV